MTNPIRSPMAFLTYSYSAAELGNMDESSAQLKAVKAATVDAIKNESHKAFPDKGAASPRSAQIPAPSIMPIPETVTSKRPNFRFKDLINSPP